MSDIELPGSSLELLLEIGRAHLAYNHLIAFGEEAPEDIFTKELMIKAALDWRVFRARGLLMLIILAIQTRSHLRQQGHQAAVRYFTSQSMANSEIQAVIRTPSYLQRLINAHIDDAQRFETLLKLIQQLGKPSR